MPQAVIGGRLSLRSAHMPWCSVLFAWETCIKHHDVAYDRHHFLLGTRGPLLLLSSDGFELAQVLTRRAPPKLFPDARSSFDRLHVGETSSSMRGFDRRWVTCLTARRAVVYNNDELPTRVTTHPMMPLVPIFTRRN